MTSVAGNTPIAQFAFEVHFCTRIERRPSHQRKLIDRSNVTVLWNEDVPTSLASVTADNTAGEKLPPSNRLDEVFWSIAGIDKLQFGFPHQSHDSPTTERAYIARPSQYDAPKTYNHETPSKCREIRTRQRDNAPAYRVLVFGCGNGADVVGATTSAHSRTRSAVSPITKAAKPITVPPITSNIIPAGVLEPYRQPDNASRRRGSIA